MFKMTRDKNRCIGCGECVVICPQSQPDTAFPVLVSPGHGQIPHVEHIENCIQCASCLDVCRASAITFIDANLPPRLIVDARLEAQVLKIL